MREIYCEDTMQGDRFDEDRDFPLFVIRTDDGCGMLTQTNERGECESIVSGSARLRAIADYLDGIEPKNTDHAATAGIDAVLASLG